MASRLGWGIHIFFNTPTPNEKPNENLIHMQVYNDGDELASITACSHSAQLFCFVPRHVNVPPHVMKIDSAGNRVFFQKNKGYFYFCCTLINML